LDPCEHVLVWCAYELFGLTGELDYGAGAGNFPIPQLAQVLSRRPHDVAEAMWVARGLREPGTEAAADAASRFLSRPAEMDALYLRILAGARSAGIGPDVLPDYLCLDVEGPRWQSYRRNHTVCPAVWF